jgi:hypothetical protein
VVFFFDVGLPSIEGQELQNLRVESLVEARGLALAQGRETVTDLFAVQLNIELRDVEAFVRES